MKIKIEAGEINVDDHGTVMLFEPQGGHGEVTLGVISDKGEFTPAFWLEADAGLETEIKRALAMVYFREKQGVTRRT